jgi:hypothetical protein
MPTAAVEVDPARVPIAVIFPFSMVRFTTVEEPRFA